MRVLLPLKKSATNNHLDNPSSHTDLAEAGAGAETTVPPPEAPPESTSLEQQQDEVVVSSAAASEVSARSTTVSGVGGNTRQRKRPAPACGVAVVDSASGSGVSTDNNKKRFFRSDSKPPARKSPRLDLTKNFGTSTMAGGRRSTCGRQGDENDSFDPAEEKYEEDFSSNPAAECGGRLYLHHSFHLQPSHQPPLENEPPSFENNHAAAVAASSRSNSSVSAARSYESNCVSNPAGAACLEDDPAEEGFHQDLKKRGLEIVEQQGDGNCLFRAVSLQVYGDSSMHGEVRERCMDFMAADEAHFGKFITGEAFGDYIARKRQDGVHGNNPEIQALSELFNRPVEVFTPHTGSKPLNIFHAEYKTGDAPIRLSYHDGNHYNAVVDPLVPTAGLGLGLPGLQPGLADKMQVAKAVAESDKMADQMELERALKESQNDEVQRKIKETSFCRENMYKNKAIVLSDLDATNFELEQAALESSLESYRHQEHGRKQRASPTVGRGRRRGRSTPPIRVVPNQQQEQHSSLPAFSESTSAVAAIPPVAAAAAAPPPHVPYAAAASASASSSAADPPAEVDYPQVVQELVMNGFDLRKVVHAYDLVGDNFDDLLAYLMSSAST